MRSGVSRAAHIRMAGVSHNETQSSPEDNWNRSAAPPTPDEVVQRYNLERRQRLLRILTLGFIGALVLLIPSAFIPSPNVVTVLALGAAFCGTALAYLLNRQNLVGPAGYVFLAGMSLAIAFEIVGKSFQQGGVDLVDLRLFDLFAIPILLSGVILSRRGPLIVATCTSLASVAILLLLHHSPALQAYWDERYPVHGSVYDVLAVALFIQILTAVAAWLGADSMSRALLGASRANELATANAVILDQRRRLQEGIAQLQYVHSAVARGQWDVRASVGEGELLPVAVSLNLLLDRLGRLMREQGEQARMDAAAHELALALRRLRAGEPYTPPAYTGTAIDEVLVEVSMLRSAAPRASNQAGNNVSSSHPSSGPHAADTPSPGPVVISPAPVDLASASWPDLYPKVAVNDGGTSDTPPEELPFWLRRER